MSTRCERSSSDRTRTHLNLRRQSALIGPLAQLVRHEPLPLTLRNMRDIDLLVTRILNERGPGQLTPKTLTTASGRRFNMLMMDVGRVVRAMFEDLATSHLLDFRARRVRIAGDLEVGSAVACCLGSFH